jgi:hypothetical protein
MGIKYTHPDILDGGLLALKNGATRLLLVKKYTAGDSYATVTGNAIVSITVASTDFTIANGTNGARQITLAAKSAAATGAGLAANASGEDHEFVLTDGSSRVLQVFDETSEQANQVGDTITTPALTYTSNQPT